MGTTATTSERLTLSAQVWDPEDAVARLGLDGFARGAMPFAREVEVRRCAPLTVEAVEVADGRVARWVDQVRSTYVLLEGEGWSATLARVATDRPEVATATAWVFAVDPERAAHVGELLHKALETDAADDAQVTIRAWDEKGGVTDRTADAPTWAEVRPNYPETVRPALDRLVALRPEATVSGRLAVLHGIPGTGKSTFIRALARAWRDWCATEVLSDPRQTLQHARSLDGVLFSPGRTAEGATLPWKLLVVEDAHELVVADAAGGASDALTRLLHATDGVLGGQARVIFLLTTNQRVDRLHPAILRPGRCLADIEIPAHTPAQAAAWLGPGTPAPAHDVTLADLYATRADHDVIRHRIEAPAPGQYL